MFINNININAKEYLIKKYGTKLTSIISEDELSKIEFNCVDIYGGDYIYNTTDSNLIDTIKLLERKNKFSFNDFTFITINNKFIKYVSFDFKSIADCISCMMRYDILCKCPFKLYKQCYSNYDEATIYKYYLDQNFLCININVNKYYEDLLLSGIKISDLHNYLIDNIKEDIISYEVNNITFIFNGYGCKSITTENYYESYSDENSDSEENSDDSDSNSDSLDCIVN